MKNPDVPVEETFLRLKAKAARGAPWTSKERAAIKLSLEKEGRSSILAACCVLVTKHREVYDRALQVVQNAVGSENPAPYVELSIYEALICIEAENLAPFRDEVLSFIERSLTRRAVNLDNTIFLLGRFARLGERRAVALLRCLARDSSVGIRDTALGVVQGLEDE
jgi:hypothetical protein